MSMAGAQANRRREVGRTLEALSREHGAAIAAEMAKQFQPVYDRVLHRAKLAEERAAVLQTAVELIALGLPHFDGSNAEYAQQILDQLGIVPDVQVLEQ